MRTTDIVGLGLLLLGIAHRLMFPSARHRDLGSYSLSDFIPIILVAGGAVTLIIGRLRNGPRGKGPRGARQAAGGVVVGG